MTTATSITMKVSTVNRDALLRLGAVMMIRHPELWDKTPSFNAIIGYALTHLADDLPADLVAA